MMVNCSLVPKIVVCLVLWGFIPKSSIIFFSIFVSIYIPVLRWFVAAYFLNYLRETLLVADNYKIGEWYLGWPSWLSFRPYYGRPLQAYFNLQVVRDFNVRHGSTLYGYHPHGIFPMGVISAHISMHPANHIADYVGTISLQFRIPMWREALLRHGLVDVKRETCMRILRAGHSLVLVPGGAREALLAVNQGRPRFHSHKKSLFDKNEINTIINGYDDDEEGSVVKLLLRRSFFELALRSSVKFICPVYCPGELGLFEGPRKEAVPGWLGRMQLRLKDIFGYTIPLVWGTGGWAGILPGRGPLHLHVGQPISVQCLDVNDNDDDEGNRVELLMAKYEAELRRLHVQSKCPRPISIHRIK